MTLLASSNVWNRCRQTHLNLRVPMNDSATPLGYIESTVGYTQRSALKGRRSKCASTLLSAFINRGDAPRARALGKCITDEGHYRDTIGVCLVTRVNCQNIRIWAGSSNSNNFSPR